jgi:hypothetical protein
MGMVFMSSRPEEEHHEFLICGGRNVRDKAALLLQQVSFRWNSLDDVIGYYKRFKDHNVQFDMIVSHGNAVDLFSRDPEVNRCEVYWPTGLKARQPYLEMVNLDEDPAEIMRKIKESVAEHGENGIVDMTALQMQERGGSAAIAADDERSMRRSACGTGCLPCCSNLGPQTLGVRASRRKTRGQAEGEREIA